MRVVYLLLFLIGGQIAYSQPVDYDRIILPDHITAAQFEEKLVRLAWKNYPQNRIGELEHMRARNNVHKASWNWLNRVTVSGNLNEFTLDPESHERAEFYPRYNFNISVPLGIFVSQVNDVKIARATMEIETEQIKQLKLNIRTQVLTRYEEYHRMDEILKLKTDAMQAVERKHIKAAGTKGAEGEAAALSDQLLKYKEDIIVLTSSRKLAKLKVEELIGVKLEEVE